MNYPDRDEILLRASQSSIDTMLKALKIGAPLSIAMTYARFDPREYEWCKSVRDQVKKAEDANLFALNIKDQTIRVRCEEEGIDYELVKRIRAKKTYASAPCELIAKIEQAQAEAVMYHLTRMANKDKFINWQASAWMLERRYPQFFSKEEERKPEAKQSAIRVQYVDPSKDKIRLDQMEKELEEEAKKDE